VNEYINETGTTWCTLSAFYRCSLSGMKSTKALRRWLLSELTIRLTWGGRLA